MRSILVIGNGPSLRGVDLRRFSRIDTLGMNAAYRHWERIDWWPTHYCCLDDALIETHHAEIRTLVERERVQSAFVTARMLELHPDLASDSRFVFLDQFISYWHEQRGKALGLPLTCHEAFDSVDPTWLTTGSYSVRYAIWRGYSDIGLLGIDLDYVPQIAEARPEGGLRLKLVDTPVANPNYFFDDYQREGDAYQIPNPPELGADLHVRSFETLRDDLVQQQSPVRVFNCNPDSQLTKRGIFPFRPLGAHIGEPALSAVVVPTHIGEQAALLANMALWDRPGFAPTIGAAGGNRPKLIISLSNVQAEQMEPALEQAFEQHRLDRYFSDISFLRIRLEGAADLYERAEYGSKAGPNNQFFETMALCSHLPGFVFYLEADCVPIRAGWLSQLMDELDRERGAWIVGSVYRGRGGLDPIFASHLNGNAAYAVGDSQFQLFLEQLRSELGVMVRHEHRGLPYDCALSVRLSQMDCSPQASENGRRWWQFYQSHAHRFRATSLVQNISAPIDNEQPVADIVQRILAESPQTALIHGRSFMLGAHALLQEGNDAAPQALRPLPAVVGSPVQDEQGRTLADSPPSSAQAPASVLQLLARGGAGVWRRRSVTGPVALVVVALIAAAFAPGSEGPRWLWLAGGGFLIVICAIMYLALRTYRFVLDTNAESRRLAQQIGMLRQALAETDVAATERAEALRLELSQVQAALEHRAPLGGRKKTEGRLPERT